MADDRNAEGGFDTDAALAALDVLETRSQSFGRALTGALKAATVDGRSLDDTLRGLANRLSDIALTASLKPLENLLAGAVGSLSSGLTRAFSATPAGGVTPFADGGIVRRPSYFAMEGGTGLMGEAGAEAILPLRRGPDGALGVAASGAASGGGGPQIIFNVTASDAASFRRTEGQVSAMLARSVGRGQRNL